MRLLRLARAEFFFCESLRVLSFFWRVDVFCLRLFFKIKMAALEKGLDYSSREARESSLESHD